MVRKIQIGLLLMLFVADLAFAEGQLSGITTTFETAKDTLVTIAKTLAIIGLIILGIKYWYTRQASMVDIGLWVVGVVVVVYADEIVEMFWAKA
jgi:type IV secretory pathway VirB2 component (pilin)